MIATAPGKLILTGEYAVLDGAPAVVVAVNRRAIARRGGDLVSSPFLLAVAGELARRYGAEHPAALAAREITVDSSAFYDGTMKLGLGSSAAVTVAATAAALGSAEDRDTIMAIALAAHAEAQAPRGTRGSGVDVMAAVLGGAIAIADGRAVHHVWPSSVTLLPFFTGVSADTPELVARVAAARVASPGAVDAALAAISSASRDTIAAMLARPPEDLIAALAAASRAIDQLAAATGVPLVPACVTAAREAMSHLGGTAKTTGAGGGDVAIAAIPASADVTTATRSLIKAGCLPLQLSVDTSGVDTRPAAK